VSILDESRLLLHWEARVTSDAGFVNVESGDSVFELRGLPPEAACALLARLDAHRTLAEAARESSVPLSVARAAIEPLLAEGVVLDAGRHGEGTIEPMAYAKSLRNLYTSWKDQLFTHKLWASLSTGEAPRSVFMGWLIENFHFIEGVNDRISLAAADCLLPNVRPVFIKHYVEEWNHGHFFIKSLRGFGVSSEEAMSSRPLPGTLAVLNHMRYCARRHPLEYASCSGFLESTGEDRKAAHLFFELLTRHYASDRPSAIKPMVDHLLLDEAYQHNSVIEHVCSHLGPISIQRASSAITNARILVETLGLWATDILRFYGKTFTLRRGFHRYRPEPVPSALMAN
jgi:pyrroloquinoline quinone (PQQ) biosynthesis protein C